MTRLVDQIRHGDKVTIVDPHGHRIVGRAVMKSSMAGCWVLNTGGRFGKTALACYDNVIKVTGK